MTICDKFEPTILESQLCYSIDVTKLEREATKTGKPSGLSLLLDPNPYHIRSTDVKAARNDQESFKVYIHTLAPHTASIKCVIARMNARFIAERSVRQR